MRAEKLVQRAPEMSEQTWLQRMDYAASILFLHGYITQSVRTSITKKLENEIRKALSEGRIVEVTNHEPS